METKTIEEPITPKEYHSLLVYAERSAAELKIIRQLLTKVCNYMVDAESEVSEKMRRFIMYMHDVHDVAYMYEERGLDVPPHVMREMERCDDRYRQLLTSANEEGGTFNKVRREMASDPLNRWDHTRQLAKPKETVNETGKSESGRDGEHEKGAKANGNLAGGGESAGDHAGSWDPL